MVSLTATERAVATVRLDGKVICWGDAMYGGKCGEEVVRVEKVKASHRAFAAISKDCIMAWGDPDFGGDCPIAKGHVLEIQATAGAFAASLDGELIVWGHRDLGAQLPQMPDFQDVQRIESTQGAFAAILGSGEVITWGSAFAGCFTEL